MRLQVASHQAKAITMRITILGGAGGFFQARNTEAAYPVQLELLQQNVRGCDLAARYGGDEFTLVLPETPGRQASVGADRLRKMVEALPIHVVDKEGKSEHITITISIGVAEYPYDANSAEMLVELADIALYQAKHQGCNQVVRYLGKPVS